ncbi:MAG: hypothetical protein ACP5I7_02330 [Sulfolobales archaeon]
MPGLSKEGVLVVADWDADGAVAAATILYSQKYECAYPIKRCLDVDLRPSEPYGAFKNLSSSLCYDALAILDIPIIKISYEYLREYRLKCGETKIIYADHHMSTHRELHRFMDLIDEPLVGYVPTSKILYDKILLEGASKNPRLEKFVLTIYYMDQGLKVPSDLKNIMRLLSSISKYMAHKKDSSSWIKVVEWLAPKYIHSSLDPDVLQRMISLSEELDRELKNYANELAVSAQKLGLFRYVDARRKWRRKGASSLASALYRIFRAPIVVSVLDPHEENKIILIIKFPGKAYKVATLLEREGLIENVGGHPSLVIVKLNADNLIKVLNLLKSIRYI